MPAMRILVAPDKFKDCLSANEVADAIARGLRGVDPKIEIDLCPMADGGEGFVDALVRSTGGRFITHRVTGPLPEMKVDARFGLLGDGETAVIEMSSASGLHLLGREDRNPMHTTTFGTGELLKFAVQMDCRKILLGIGGSATCDGGIGCAQACGLPVLLEGGEPTSDTEPLCGRDLEKVLLVKKHRGGRVNGIDITVACDVTNPLYGRRGAARVFGPQKGASPAEVALLDAWLERLAERCAATEAAHQPGAGAAGGLGFAMLAFFNAQLRAGIDLVMQATQFQQRVKNADLVITGEGNLDASSAGGKVVSGVAGACLAAGVKCVAICGDTDGSAISGLHQVVNLSREAGSSEESMRNARQWIERAVVQLL